MERRGYRITFAGKIVIVQFLITLIGVLCGFTWKTYSENKKWDKLIYPGISVWGIDLGGKTAGEGKKIINSQYKNYILKKKVNIVANGKNFVLENSKLIKNVDIDNAIEMAFNYGKSFDEYKKSKLIKEGCHLQYDVQITFNESYIKETIASIEKSINTEPVNATIHKVNESTLEVSPDIKGYKVEAGKLEDLIKKVDFSKEVYIHAPFQSAKADITTEKLSNINTKIASFNTSFSTSTAARINNIELATGMINGKLLMPNESFSFNDSVGERTKERGFMQASVVVGDRVELGYGGGICQVSTTLYNAVLKTGIKPFERMHHTLPSSYVQLGMDATVDWDDIDFKFKNTLAYPIYIEGYLENKVLYINIYSNSNLAKRSYSITNDVYETIVPVTKTIDDPSLSEGQIYTVQKGIDGHRVKVKRDTVENGNVISSEIISDDFYPPIASIVRRGIKTK